MLKLDLNTSVAVLTRVGKTTAGRLKKLGIETVNDLIFYYPYRWQDFSQIYEIAKLQPTDAATVRGKIQLIGSRRSFKTHKVLTEAIIADDSGSVKSIWFNQSYLTKMLQPGDEVYLSGKVDYDKYTLQFINPVYEKASGDTTHTARIIPLYSLTSNLTQKQIRFLIKTALPAISLLADRLPPSVITANHLFEYGTALRQIHFPSSQQNLDAAIRRLKFDELFYFQLQVQLSKKELEQSRAEEISFAENETKDFVSELPFKLTGSQRQAAWQIISDLGRARPMNRLLEGDVGAGKTVVAALAMLNVALGGKQSALIAPTEILAGQHYRNLRRLFANQPFRLALLTRSQHLVGAEKKSKAELERMIKSGDVDIVVGTHALIQQGIEFFDLALAVIDEQHRFGVAQRKVLKEKSGNALTTPHLLSMTATPIPRTLTLALYGDLDLSLLKEMPAGRKKIITKIVEPNDRKKAYEFVREQINGGRQAFVICPLIDPSDKLGVKAVTEEFERLDKKIFADIKIGLLHGKMKAAAKEKVMADFLKDEIKILVATSVIEVGVDVPNATVMLIEGAERFGLAQLHQFRGRVGRSEYQSYCLVFAESNSDKTRQRLSALVSAKDGFELAEYDLQFRGPGEIYGTAQSGFPEFRLATLTDQELIAAAKEAAAKVIDESPDLKKYPLVRDKVSEMIKSVHLE